MTERKPDQMNIGEELKELGRQLTATMKAVAASDQLRSLGQELKEGLREASQRVEETWEKVREREEVQRLQARATTVAESFKTGEAQQEIREEIGDAIHALNLRLGQLLERFEATPAADTGDLPAAEPPPVTPAEESYTGATRKLDS